VDLHRLLGVQPEVWRSLESRCEFKGHGRSKGRSAVDQAIDDLYIAVNMIGQVFLGHPERPKVFFPEDLARGCWQSFHLNHDVSLFLCSAMVVLDPHLLRSEPSPNERNSPLIIDSDAMKPCPIALQGFQAVSRRRPQVPQLSGVMKHVELPPHNAGDGLPWDPLFEAAIDEERLRCLI